MAGKQFRVRQKSPAWSQRPFSRRRRRHVRSPAPGVVEELVVVVGGLTISILGALLIGFRLTLIGLPFFAGYAIVATLLGAAVIVVTRLPWARALAVGLLVLALGLGVAHLYGASVREGTPPSSKAS
ncbi:MAG: hypothetical protein KA105_00230 [Caulobacter sp.]|nr:hypothetical protein [Caulobacter sp.]